MKPVLGIYAGYSLGGSFVNPGPELEPYVQDALDEIEYVTGGVDTVWGARRAADGHPAAFPLEYVEVGNEDFFDGSGSYDARYGQFDDAIMGAYAPLLVNVNPGARQWPTNLIGYDALLSYGSPSYYVQSMFGRLRGDVTLAASLTTSGGSRLFQSVTRDSSTGIVFIKLVNAASATQDIRIELTGLVPIAAEGQAEILASSNLEDTNTLSDPKRVVPVTVSVTGVGQRFDYSVAANSFTVLSIRPGASVGD